MYTVISLNVDSASEGRVEFLGNTLEGALKYAINVVKSMEEDVNIAFEDLISEGIHFYFDGLCIQQWENQSEGEWVTNFVWTKPSAEEIDRLRKLILPST